MTKYGCSVWFFKKHFSVLSCLLSRTQTSSITHYVPVLGVYMKQSAGLSCKHHSPFLYNVMWHTSNSTNHNHETCATIIITAIFFLLSTRNTCFIFTCPFWNLFTLILGSQFVINHLFLGIKIVFIVKKGSSMQSLIIRFIGRPNAISACWDFYVGWHNEGSGFNTINNCMSITVLIKETNNAMITWMTKKFTFFFFCVM